MALGRVPRWCQGVYVRPSMVIRPLSSDDDAKAFDALNRSWILEHFSLTPEDETVLGQPRESIISAGGEVLVGVSPAGEVIGVVAILNAQNGVYELAKMTVAEGSRGSGLGARLIGAAVDWTRARGGTCLFLGTSTKLGHAIHLYEAAGFQRTSIADLGLHNYYARADTLMKLEITRAG